ncbi:MAG: NUDIX hydrolase [Acidimicrobiia bacterium]|nr:NUDIX hydrolase [Acidimicrobiia bacterium]
MTGFRALGEEIVHRGPVVTVYRGRFSGPDGEDFEREVVRHPGAVGVVPVLDDGVTALLVRQYRAALDTLVLEIPAGKLDVEGEAHEDTGRRELVEEIGYHPGRLEELCRFHNSPGFSDELVVVYLALDLEQREAAPSGVEEEHMTTERVSLAEVDELVRSGRVTDAKTVIGLLLARDRLLGAPGR